MKALIVLLALTATVSASEFPEYDMDAFCVREIAKQLADSGAEAQVAMLAMCKNVSGMSRALAAEIWKTTSPEKQAACASTANEYYPTLHKCLAHTGKGDRLKSN